MVRVHLSKYGERGSKVYSLVARVPFTPVDLDIGRLARGEWNALTDRFRVWFLPATGTPGDRPICNLTLRKFDPDGGVLLFMHLSVNLGENYSVGTQEPEHFSLGILCNDDVRARAALGFILDAPPSFHRRTEIALVESRWRRDPAVLMYYLANVHSVASAGSKEPSAAVQVAGEASEEALAMIKKGMEGWWKWEPVAPEPPR